MKYRYFDEPTLRRVNEILKVAEEMIRENTNIEGWTPTKEEWDEYFNQYYVSLRDNTGLIYYKGNSFSRSKYRGKHVGYQILGEALGVAWDMTRYGEYEIPVENDLISKRGSLITRWRFVLNEQILLKIRDLKGEELFEAYLLYVLTHELRHIMSFYHVEYLRKLWRDENRVHKQTIEILENIEGFPKITEVCRRFKERIEEGTKGNG